MNKRFPLLLGALSPAFAVVLISIAASAAAASPADGPAANKSSSNSSTPNVPAALSAASPAAKSPADLDFSGVAKVAEQAIKDHVFPGCAVAVGNRHRLLWAQGFGHLDYDGGAAVTPDTLYDLASMTKIVGATSVSLTLVRDHKLNLADPVSKYLPEFVAAAKDDTDRQRREKVTLMHLLTHSAGLVASADLTKHGNTYPAVLKSAIDTPLQADPGARTKYSDLGLIILGEALARAGGAPLKDLEIERVFEPLKMHDTMRNPPQSLLGRIAPTERRPDGTYWHGIVHDENARAGQGLTAHAGLFSCADDLSIWAGEWLRAIHGESQIFPEPLAKQYIRRQNIVADSSRAIGWDTKSPKGSTAGKSFSADSFGHTGFTGTSVWLDPEADLYVILLTNSVHPHRGDMRIQSVRRNVAEAAKLAATGGGLGSRD